MSTVLAKRPLRITREFTARAHTDVDPESIPGAGGAERPFGYAYALPWRTVQERAPGADPQAGHYDRTAQTWCVPAGAEITAGLTTWTRTGLEEADRVGDDACG